MKLPRIALIGGPFDGLEISVRSPLTARFEIRGTLLRDSGYSELGEAFKDAYGIYRRSRRKCGVTRYRFECVKPVEKSKV